MPTFVDWLLQACSEFDLEVELGYRATLPNGVELQTVARLPKLGARNGMLLLHSYADLQGYARETVAAGYGYSVVSDPLPGEQFELDSFREMFHDWGWGGDTNAKPKWMTKVSNGNE